ncbi:MAG TPA: hypothetical protein VG839_09480, partial [Asticcacaulis sp.]|nr:hypothetical protein [Asticcacaulis sp.]
MENTQHTPIATPEQRLALRRNQQQRLRDQAEALLRAVEDLDPPKTHKDAEQAAKTLLAVDKLLDAVNAIKADDERIPPASVRPLAPEVEHRALDSWKAILDAS